MVSTVKPIPDEYRGAMPYLCARDAASAIEFYKQAFGATEVMRFDGPDGKVGHAEIRLGDAVIMLSDEYPEMGVVSPQALGGSPVGIHLYVEDVDALVNRATAAGATVRTPPEDKFYGDRSATLGDPFGHVWYFSTHIEDVTPEEMRRRAEAMMKQPAGA
jgi:PhnB protein